MKLFTVINDHQRPIIERLLEIQCKPLKERRGLIKALERDGYSVDFIGGRYQARSEGVLYRIPLKRCPGGCDKRKHLGEFLTLRGVEHPWCQGCRHEHPQEAERARAERDYHVKQGTYDAGMESRCQNPGCPNGGIISPRKLRYDPKFCSRACWRATLSGPERFCKSCGTLLLKDQEEFCSRACLKKYTYKQCANHECDVMIPPHRTYCSRACTTEHRNNIGHFREIGEKGNESQFVALKVTLKETGQVPEYEIRRRDAIAKSNSVNPRRKRVKG